MDLENIPRIIYLSIVENINLYINHFSLPSFILEVFEYAKDSAKLAFFSTPS